MGFSLSGFRLLPERLIGGLGGCPDPEAAYAAWVVRPMCYRPIWKTNPTIRRGSQTTIRTMVDRKDFAASPKVWIDIGIFLLRRWGCVRGCFIPHVIYMVIVCVISSICKYFYQ
jgi:hypothetical protein